MTNKNETYIAVKAFSMYEAIQKAYQVCASRDMLVNEQSLLEISYNEYRGLKTVFKLKNE